MKKKILTLFMTILLCLRMIISFTINTYAQEQVDSWIDQENIQQPVQVEDMFYIYTAEELAWISYKTAFSGTTFVGKTIKLMADIDLSEHQWTPIGGYDALLERADDSRFFKGVFDGNHHVIRGLTIGSEQTPYDKQFSGLIGLVEYGEIKNVHLEEVSIWSDECNCGGVVGQTNWIVRNCSVSGSIIATSSRSGTIIGYMYVQGCLENSWSSATFSGTSSSQSGGLVGYQRGNIYNCFYIGNANKCGAISGYRQEGNIENCFWAKDICNTTAGSSSSCVDLSTAITSEQMKTPAFVATLNENGNIEWCSWNISDKSIYPYHDSSLDKNRFWLLSAEAPIKSGDIYEIYTPEQLAWLSKESENNNKFTGWTFRIMQDIDLAGRYWTPVTEFRGILEGNGKRICNLKIKTAEMGGLFVSLSSAKVSKLSIENAEVVSKHGDWSGILASIISNSSTIEECKTSGEVYGRTYDLYGYAGGITGYLSDETILRNCYSTADVFGYCASGIAGRINGSSMYVQNCYAIGNLDGMECYGIAPLPSSERNQNCYWLIDAEHISDGMKLLDSEKKGISGSSPETYNVIGLTIEEMCDCDSYNDWDFESIWDISSEYNNSLPYFKWEFNTEMIPVTGIEFKEQVITIKTDTTITLQATVLPTNATNKNIIWLSSNTDVATVEYGKIYPKEQGETIITATTKDGGFSAECKVVVVSNTQITDFSVKQIGIYELITFQATNVPDDADIYIAAYDEENKLVDVLRENGTNDIIQSILPMENFVSLKAFIWRQSTIEPLCKNAEWSR